MKSQKVYELELKILLFWVFSNFSFIAAVVL